MKVAALFVALLSGAVPRPASGLLLGQVPTKQFPVTKVVQLLTDMKAQLEKEADADEEVYDKLACWCQTNDKEKAKAISEAEAHLSSLDNTIRTTAALVETLKVQIEALEKEVTQNVQSLEVATALRGKSAAAFTTEEKEMIQSIRALDAAIVVLAKHHKGAAFLSPGKLLEAVGTARQQLQKHQALLQGSITPSQRRLIMSLAQGEQPSESGNQTFRDAKPTFKEAYSARSTEIFGILQQMKETFETDLSDSQREELEAQRSYSALKAAKENEITTGQASAEDKKQQLANAEQKLAEAKQDQEDTTASLSEDQKFLIELKATCSLTDQQWVERKAARQDEIKAVTDAIVLLTSDDARDLFSRTFNPASFLQRLEEDRLARRSRTAAMLADAAKRAGDAALAALATRVHLDSFTRVKEAIDNMVAELLKEKADETTHRDWCIGELHKNDVDSEKGVHTKTMLESRIGGLEMTVTGLNSTIRTLEGEILEMQAQRRRAQEDRSAQHQEFQRTVADQRETQAVLQQVVERLHAVYKAAETQTQAALLQRAAGASRQEPALEGFQAYKKSGAASSILALLQQIITDAKAMEAEVTRAETQAQDAYTALVQQTTDAVALKQAGIVDRTSERSKAEQELLQARAELAGTTDQLALLSRSAGAIHGSCDYILKNFEVRQEARDQEVEALRQAKAILSGMKLE